MIVEILNPQGVVSYTRPHDHPDVAEAMRTEGYAVRVATFDQRVIQGIPALADLPITLSKLASDGITYFAPPKSRPVLTSCVDCGENTPEHGLICDECRMDTLGD